MTKCIQHIRYFLSMRYVHLHLAHFTYLLTFASALNLFQGLNKLLRLSQCSDIWFHHLGVVIGPAGKVFSRYYK